MTKKNIFSMDEDFPKTSGAHFDAGYYFLLAITYFSSLISAEVGT